MDTLETGGFGGEEPGNKLATNSDPEINRSYYIFVYIDIVDIVYIYIFVDILYINICI